MQWGLEPPPFSLAVLLCCFELVVASGRAEQGVSVPGVWQAATDHVPLLPLHSHWKGSKHIGAGENEAIAPRTAGSMPPCRNLGSLSGDSTSPGFGDHPPPLMTLAACGMHAGNRIAMKPPTLISCSSPSRPPVSLSVSRRLCSGIVFPRAPHWLIFCCCWGGSRLIWFFSFAVIV